MLFPECERLVFNVLANSESDMAREKKSEMIRVMCGAKLKAYCSLFMKKTYGIILMEKYFIIILVSISAETTARFICGH